MDASGGRIGLGVSPSPSELFRECALPFEPCVGDFLSVCGEPGLAVLPSLLSGTFIPVAAALRDDKEEEERDVREETEKDCSNGFGSRSKLFRRGGRGGG